MSLARNKRGIELATLIEMILIVVATGLIIGVFTVTSSRADEKTSQNLCRGFNALRFGTELETPIGTYNIAPRACKTIDKKDLPGKDYQGHPKGPTEAAKAEVRDLMARCWWMWLEGREKNMFDKSWYNLQNGCFICYTFSLDKDANQFSYKEFAYSLADTPYYATDSTDRCAPAGQGGKCMASCDKSSDFPREVASSRCKENEKCCIATDNRDECKNKGGECLNEPKGDFKLRYDKWQCKSGSCYIKAENMATYLDYVEYVGGGKGKILFAEDGGFSSGSKYGVTFVSPGKSMNWDILLGPGIAVAAGIASGVLTGGISTVVALTGVIFGSAQTISAGTVNDLNYIFISKYDTVSSKCAIEAGVGEKS